MLIEVYEMVILLYFLQFYQNDFWHVFTREVSNRNYWKRAMIFDDIWKMHFCTISSSISAKTRANPFLEYIRKTPVAWVLESIFGRGVQFRSCSESFLASTFLKKERIKSPPSVINRHWTYSRSASIESLAIGCCIKKEGERREWVDLFG